MAKLQFFFLFLLGLCTGSFLNVVIYRLNHNLSPIGGRSFCPHCKRKIKWQDNLPLLSFFLLRGRCRSCHSPISWQYPLVEIATGLAFLLIGWLVLGSRSLSPLHCYISIFLNCYIVASLIAIFVSDLRYQVIPDEVVYPGMVIALLSRLRDGMAPQPSAAGIFNVLPVAQLGSVLLAGLAAAAFFWFLVLVTRGKGMGMGDVKLAGLMGFLLGFPQVLVALFLAFLTGAAVGVILVLLEKRGFGDQIPFGPFLVAATAVSWLWGGFLWNWYRLSLLGL